MAISRLNHAVLFVADLERSVAFYRDVLGFRRLPAGFTGAAFLQAPDSANDHDPDGIEFELCWLVPDDAVAEELAPGTPPTRALDIDAEIARYGAATPTGTRTDQRLWEQIFGRDWARL